MPVTRLNSYGGIFVKILVINGPNINMLGIREPNIYGKATYSDLVEMIKEKAVSLNLTMTDFIVECCREKEVKINKRK